jgi:hypothetical protein
MEKRKKAMAQVLDCLGPTPTNFIPYFSLRLTNGIGKGMSIFV